MKRTSLFMCDLCFPDGIEIGEIAPGYVLILDQGKYHILNGQGHKGDEIYSFPKKPEPHPDPDRKHLGGDIELAAKAWVQYICRIDLEFQPETAYSFIKECLNSDYQEGDSFIYWLYDRSGILVKQFEEGIEVPKSKKEAGTWDYRIMVRNLQSDKKTEGCPASKCYSIHEVHYDDEGKPNAWSKSQIEDKSFEGLKWTLEKMLEALEDPILEDNAEWPSSSCNTSISPDASLQEASSPLQ